MHSFLDVQKAYDTVWRDGLWLKLWDMGVQGEMWCVVKGMYEVNIWKYSVVRWGKVKCRARCGTGL